MKQFILSLVLFVFVYAEYNYTNVLIEEDSPYLQQHAHNPIDWYPWGEEALQKAKQENKLIFLSIGYSTCHWCHVMEEESFTDTYIAELLNRDFISIKVDREEYPQLDKKYQEHYMARYNKRGGWPLSVFLSSDVEVFHIGRYIPRDEGYGSKGLVNLLHSFVKLKKDENAFQKAINKHTMETKKEPLKSQLNMQIIDKVIFQIEKQFDATNGGFASRPKFPEASKINLLLDIYKLTNNKKAFHMAEKTLREMAEGGIYDQIGGGFFRYTTDYAWQIPHFEKMLYTNAQLIPLYVKLYEITQDTLYKKVVDETIAQMHTNFTEKGFYLSASDADSDGEEGGYFIYAYEEVKEVLKDRGWNLEEIEETLSYLGIEEDGNIDGELSHTHITSQKIPRRLAELKAYLKSESDKRTFPFVDKKINTAWSSMMIKALFEASRLDERYLEVAKKRLDALLSLMRKKDVLYHQTLLGKVPKQEGLLEDYAFLIDALLSAYDRTYDKKYLQLSEVLAQEALPKFYRNKLWYLSNDGIKIVADFDDRYYTSPLSQMLENLVKLGSLTLNTSYSTMVQDTIKSRGAILENNPEASPHLVHTFLRLKLGDIIIHANKEKLLFAKPLLDKVAYPFLLSAVQESDEYLACSISRCFAYDKNITKLIEKIDKAVK